MIVIIGLGNPGDEYAKTYHNMGYRSVSAFASAHGLEFTKNKYNAYYAQGVINGQKVIVLKPTTYMNLSGVSVSECVKSLKLPLDKLLVVYDDIDLPFGTLRLRKNGSAGTHNGMRNIIASLGSENFPRLRIGIGRDDRKDLKDYVLSKLSKEHEEVFDDIKNKIVNVINAFVNSEGNVESIDINNF